MHPFFSTDLPDALAPERSRRAELSRLANRAAADRRRRRNDRGRWPWRSLRRHREEV